MTAPSSRARRKSPDSASATPGGRRTAGRAPRPPRRAPARRRRGGAGGVDVRPRREPLPEQHRLGGRRHRADQVRPRHRLAGRGHRLHGDPQPLPFPLGEPPGALRPPAPHPHPAQRAHRAHRLQVGPRLRPRAEDRQVPRLGPRQRPGRHRAGRGRADAGHRGGVQQGDRPPPLRLEQQDHPLVRLLAVEMVLRDHREHLDPGDHLFPRILRRQPAEHPRHHHQQPVAVRHPVGGAQGLDGVAPRQRAQRALHHLDALRHRQQGFDVLAVQEEEGHGWSLHRSCRPGPFIRATALPGSLRAALYLEKTTCS